MHTLVEMLQLSRQEFERNLVNLSDEDSRRRLEPMNCISWIIGHVACQHRAFFVDWPAGSGIAPRYLPYNYRSPASQPPLDEVMALWREAGDAARPWLETVTDEILKETCPNPLADGENWGALMVRCIFHTWCHLGEISSIRQIMGHRPPQFVDMHDWSYGGA